MLTLIDVFLFFILIDISLCIFLVSNVDNVKSSLESRVINQSSREE